MTTSPFPLTPEPLHVPQAELDELRVRLRSTRWPIDANNADWYYGVSKQYLTGLVEYWADEFDWRAAERRINAYEQYFVEVDGVPVHFMRKAGVGPHPTPLILSHGWPWTFWHWSKVIDRLADPGAFGGDPADAFDVIVPSLPGMGFSTPLDEQHDMNFWKIADLWHILMTDVLGHERYAVGGSDMGSLVSSQLGHKYADEVIAIHQGSSPPLTLFSGDRAWDLTRGATVPADAAPEVAEGIRSYQRRFAAHVAVHVLDSSTVAFGFSDSPVGMLAWILERWRNWSHSNGDIESVFTKDELLTHATIFWVTNCIGTSMRLYANGNRYPWQPSHDRQPPVEAPIGITFVGYENPPGVSSEDRVANWLDSERASWFNHVNLTAHEEGGHFVPWEIPDLFVDDLLRTFRGRR